MLSYWERQSFTQYDHIIVGAGIVGLSLALELRQRYPQSSILVLERGLLPTGASTRNAGFACMGSVTELLDDLQHSTEAEVVALFAARKSGLELLRARLGDERIGFSSTGSHELIPQESLDALNHIDRLNELLMPVTGKAAFRLASERIPEFGLDTGYTKALIAQRCEGALHSGMMMRALTNLALSQGIEIKTGAHVSSYEETPPEVRLQLADPQRREALPLRCQTLSICTNAFTGDLLPGLDLKPGRGQVLITQPIPGLKLRGIFHMDAGYYYFRETDGRVLLGGGRNLDFTGEQTTDIELHARIQDDLTEKLRSIILPGTPFEVDMRWAGIMAFGQDKRPIVRAFSERVFGAFRMGGMGVALGSRAARQLAGIIAERY